MVPAIKRTGLAGVEMTKKKQVYNRKGRRGKGFRGGKKEKETEKTDDKEESGDEEDGEKDEEVKEESKLKGPVRIDALVAATGFDKRSLKELDKYYASKQEEDEGEIRGDEDGSEEEEESGDDEDHQDEEEQEGVELGEKEVLDPTKLERLTLAA